MTKDEFDGRLRDIESRRAEIMKMTRRRDRYKPIEQDGRRNSGVTDREFIRLYVRFRTQTRLAAELNISQAAVYKRLKRIAREQSQEAAKAQAHLRSFLESISPLL